MTIGRFSWHTAGQLSSENETKNNAAVYSASYTYTPYGNRAQMNYTSGGTTEVTDYTYDANNRLTNEATSVVGDLKSAIRYYYDENGNTTAEQKSVYTTTGTQSSNMSISGHSGGSTMKLYRYDEFNRLIKYNDDGTEAKYTYGVDNLRATKTVNGTTTSYVWNGQNLASETKDNTTTVYYYDPLGVNGAKTDNNTFVRYIKDPHGNVIATSKNSTLFGTYDYTAFGNQLEATDTINPFRYCGEYYDEENGLTYLRNRYYNSATGRFISEDPIRDGVNWYIYCGSNPVALVDPLGLSGNSSSKVPSDLDWDGDGRIDTKEDRAYFDADGNHIADWNEDRTYIAPKEWYSYKNSNIISNFRHVDQGYTNCCWAANIAQSVGHLTHKELDFIQVAKDEYGDNYNKGHSNPHGQANVIIRHGYLEGSNYVVDENYFNQWHGNKNSREFTFEDVMTQIDNQIPIVVKVPKENHVVTIVGYAYDEVNNKKMILIDNTNESALQYRELVQFDGPNKSSCYKNQPAYTFKTVK